MCSHEAFYGIGEEFFSRGDCVHTSKEIAHQPKLWNCLARELAGRSAEISSFMKKIGDISQVRIIFTGAGSSAFVGDALSVLIAKYAGVRTESIHTTDIVTSPGSHLFADIPTLIISFARSGNSPESVGAIKYARTAIKDLFEIAIVCDDTSNLYHLTRESDKSMILVMPEGSNDNGFAMTSSVSCMLLAGYALFNLDRVEDLLADIALISEHIKDHSLELTEAASKWAGRDFDRIVYLGCGFLKHVAHEASLKMMELTNGAVSGSFDSATGFRHGFKSVIKDNTLTVHMISDDPFTARYDVDLLKEVCNQQKQNIVIAICGNDAGDVPGDGVIRIPSGGFAGCGELFTGLQMLVFCQMLAMFKSLSLGVTTDDPSPSGAVNRVVKGVIIYDY